MNKNELIQKLQSIDSNPVVLLADTELGFIEVKGVKFDKMHQSIAELDEYVTDFEFEGEIGCNTFFHDNYKEDVTECILLNL